jgi:hypothetical protein
VRIWTSAFASLLSGDSVDDVIRGKVHSEDLIAAE